MDLVFSSTRKYNRSCKGLSDGGRPIFFGGMFSPHFLSANNMIIYSGQNAKFISIKKQKYL